MKEFIAFLEWIINHWMWWGILFAGTGALKLIGNWINSRPNIFG